MPSADASSQSPQTDGEPAASTSRGQLALTGPSFEGDSPMEQQFSYAAGLFALMLLSMAAAWLPLV